HRLHDPRGLVVVDPLRQGRERIELTMATEERVRRADGPRPRAVLVGVKLPDVTEEIFESSLAALTRLADTLGLAIVARVTQRRASLAPGAVLGEGKLRQLAAFTGGSGVVPGFVKPGTARDDDAQDEDDEESPDDALETKATLVLVDHDLSPSQ